MIATTFAYSAGNYSLTVDASKESVTSNWLTQKACQFARYFSTSTGTVRYTFFDISVLVVNQLRAKFGCIVAATETQIKKISYSVYSEYVAVCNRFERNDGGLNNKDYQFLIDNNLDICDEIKGLLEVYADVSFIQSVDEEVEGLLDLHLEIDVIELAKFQASRTQSEVKVADISWLKPEEDEFDFAPHCIDVISMAKFRAMKDAKRYKLRGEEVIKVSDISFPIADSIRRYKMRGFEVVKFAALAA